MTNKFIRLAIAVGDPLGIGPEITAKALALPDVVADTRVVVLGPVDVLNAMAAKFAPTVRFAARARLEDCVFTPGVFDVLALPPESGAAGIDFAAKKMGTLDVDAGRASVEYVVQAAHLALDGHVDAVVTGPINKESVQAAGYTHLIGNTEILEEVCQKRTGRDFKGACLTMLISRNLRVAHVTRHVAFRDIASRLTPGLLLTTLRLTHLGMVSLGFPHARIALAGLNPHNGDGGLMGDEEPRLLEPAVAAARAEGLNVVGPIPPDTVFHHAIKGRYDAVVALYHDQGHIAVKTYGFEESISVSFNLPVIRTSVDHGTAFDIAGQGIAHPTSLVEAVKMARHIVGVGQWQVA